MLGGSNNQVLLHRCISEASHDETRDLSLVTHCRRGLAVNLLRMTGADFIALPHVPASGMGDLQ